ncbi:MAG: HEAT repeat domain-containing protein [Spirochaetes bacterium]|nr:HEAT repeat domain-containing protein [Spirochaetota bacterium]
MGVKKYLLYFIFIFCAAASLRAEEKKNKEIINQLLSGNELKVNNALEIISANRSPELLPLISLAIISDEKSANKAAAIKALKYYPHRQAASYCIEIIKNTNSFIIRKEIIDYLAGSTDRQAVPAIINELGSPFFAVRESAILALKKIGDDRMFPYILNMMENRNPVFKVYALKAIYHLYDLRFYDHLIKMLKDENKSIRYYVFKCIEANNLKSALPNIRNLALNDSSWEVRVKAIQILESFLDRKSQYVLLTCLRDAEREVRYYSSKALNKLKFAGSAVPVSAALYSEPDDEIKEILMNTLIALNNGGGFKGLKNVLLKDDNYRMRILSSYALGRIKHKWSSLILLEAKNDASKEVRAEICNSLGFYNDKKIINELLDVVNNEPEAYVRSAALFSLKRMGSRQAVLPLFDRFTAENDPVVKEQIRFVLRGLIKEAK